MGGVWPLWVCPVLCLLFCDGGLEQVVKKSAGHMKYFGDVGKHWVSVLVFVRILQDT